MTADITAVPYTGPDGSFGALHQVLAHLADGLLTITLNCPQRNNVIGVQMALDIDRLLQAVATDTEVRVVVLRGAGDNFCAGLDDADFNDAAAHDARQSSSARAAAERCRTRWLRVLPQPVIGMVCGVCAGAAIGLIESCDIVVCADEARFSLPDTADENVLSALSAKAVSRVMSARAVSLHALTGKPFDGRQAEEFGLVTQSWPAAELARKTHELVAELLSKDALALQFTKETLRHVGAMDWDAVLNFNAAKFAELKSLQAGRPSPRAAAVESFLAGKSKPGLGA